MTIKSKSDHELLLASGMFFVFHPELSGVWEKDKDIILDSLLRELGIN